MYITLRPLEEKDAYTSWRWRNDPEVFANTGRRYSGPVTLEDELQWIRTVLARPDERRFAIIADGVYIGNVYLTGIKDMSAEISIFIGEKEYWNQGIGTVANALCTEYAFKRLALNQVSSSVRIENKASGKAYEKLNFSEISHDNEFVYYRISRYTFLSGNYKNFLK